jgi:glycosyltransferase involved in cell wall biosynthesis
MPTVSVIVRFRNHAGTLQRVLAALATQSRPHELIGVDSGSTDGSRLLAEKAGARIVAVPPAQFSYGRAINDGIEAARGDTLVLVSAHSVPATPDAIERLVAPLANPQVAGAYGRQVPFPGMNPFEARIIREYYGDSPLLQRDDPRFSNAWSAIRRDVWDHHPFDETVPGAEDQHWAKAVQRRGLAVAYVPDARVSYEQQFGLKGFYDRVLRLSFAGQALRHGTPPRLHQALVSAAQLVAQDLVAWRRGEIGLRWLLRSPSFRVRQSLGLRRGARLAARLLEWH